MLAKEISLLKAGVAHDMQLIRTGEQGDNFEHLKYVCFDKMSPKFNMVKVLMTNILSLEEPAAKPGRASKATEKNTLPIAGELDGATMAPVATKERVNVFEMISREVVNGGAGR